MLVVIVCVCFFAGSDGASVQIQEDGLAQAAVQTATQGRGGLFQDDAALQHHHVRNHLDNN